MIAKCGGSRHKGRGPHHVTDPDMIVARGGQFNVSQYFTFISSLEGDHLKSIDKLDGVLVVFPPPDLPLCCII